MSHVLMLPQIKQKKKTRVRGQQKLTGEGFTVYNWRMSNVRKAERGKGTSVMTTAVCGKLKCRSVATTAFVHVHSCWLVHGHRSTRRRTEEQLAVRVY